MLVNPQKYSHRFFQLLLTKPFSINPKDYIKIEEETSKHKTFIEAIKKTPQSEFVEPNKIEKFIKTFEYLSDYKTQENIRNTILEIGAKTGIFDYYLNV